MSLDIDIPTLALYFADVIRHPELYQILVIANNMDKKGFWDWIPTMRFLKSDNYINVETFLHKTNEPFGRRAKYSASYEVIKIIDIDPNGKEFVINPRWYKGKEVLN